MATEFDTTGLNRAGRRAAEKRAKRTRTAGAALAAGAATFSTTAAVLGVGMTAAGAVELTVTNTDPTGAGSLHDVAETANDNDVIVFQAGLSGTIALTEEINIDTSVTIQGPGAGVITVSGGGDERIFNINGATHANVVISGLTLTDGDASFGGAILVDDGSLTLRDMVITGNNSTDGGGAIASEDDDQHLVIENSQITGNTADESGGAIYWYSDGGSATITNSTIDGNTAGDDGGAGWFQLFNSPSPFSLTGSSVSGNTAGDEGGGLAVYFAPGVNITNSTISGNTGEGGGGAFLYYIPGSVNITGSTISGNTATSGEGGGLYVYWVYGGDVNISNTTISGNTADGGGGGAWISYVTGNTNITGSVISGNTSGGWGGGLYLTRIDGLTTIAFTTIDGNSATQEGGGIEWFENEGLLLRNSTISGNTAGGFGGGIYVSVDNYDTVVIVNSTISGNTAGDEGGGISFGSYYGLAIAQSTITGNTGASVGGLFIYCPSDQAEGAHAKEVRVKEAAEPAREGHERPQHTKPVKEQRVRAQDFGDVALSGTIISGNSGTDVGECGNVLSQNSLLGTVAGASLSDLGGNILGQLPLVAPLANNGGPTQTHALLPDSLAINAGPVPVADFPGNEFDQRGEGFARVVAGVVDIGAYEVQPPPVNFTG